jgi:phosphatidylserine decarboxylase
MADAIRYWNRKTQREEQEQVYGDAFVRWLYGTRTGQAASDAVLSRHAFSKLYGAYQASRLSAHKVAPFIAEFKIPMEEYAPGPFRTFNDFFIREFRPGRRVFAADPGTLPAFAEARYLGYRAIRPEQVFPVKGEHLSAEALLGDAAKARPFVGGPLLLARLCPVDYHRFHYPDDGRTLESYPVHGALHSVNPLALRYRSEILATNERAVSILETRNFGKLAYIEVGAMMVGLIVQTHKNPDFRRGDEKGYFLFGASTVIVLGEPGAWTPSADLLENSAREREVLVRLGEPLAQRS